MRMKSRLPGRKARDTGCSPSRGRADGKCRRNLERLFLSYPYHRYHGYGIAMPVLLARRWRDVLSAGGRRDLLAGERGRGNGCMTVLADSVWDSGYFGKKIKEIKYMIGADCALLERAVSLCRERGVSLLTARVDSGDSAALSALSSSGFTRVDTILTFIYRKGAGTSRSYRSIYTVRRVRDDDHDFLRSLAGSAFTRDRFHCDPGLRTAAGGVFSEWIGNACRRPRRGEHVLVACRNNGEPVGFLSYLLDRECLEACGTRIIGRGLSAVLPSASGAYVSLVSRVLELTDKSYDIAEFSTQAANSVPLRIWQKLGLEFAGAGHTFHKWL